MKTTKIMIAIIGIIAAAFFMNAMQERMYTAEMFVRSVNYQTDTVVVSDYDGNEFAFKHIDGWIPGDICEITFNNKGTENIKDDVIVDKKFIARVK